METIQERKVTKLGALTFVGKPAVTTNEAEMKGEGVIPSQWGDFFQNQRLESIPHKKNANIVAIYTNYESDETGPYTFAIGAEVTSAADIPSGLESFEVPECDYVVFTTRKGNVHEIIVEAWQYIWEWSKSNKRAFLTDFELYDERAQDPENSQVDIYISVR